MKNGFQRQHPLFIIHAFSKYILLLLLPLLRTLVILWGDFFSWLSGAWFDILILCMILTFGFLQWLFSQYRLEENGLTFKNGLLFRNTRYLPYKNLSSVALESPFYLRPLKVVRLRLETDAGSKKRADVSLLLKKGRGEEVFAASSHPFRKDRSGVQRYKPRALYIAILSFITSHTLTGVLFAATFINQSGKLLGREFEELLVHSLTRIVQFLAFGLPPAAAGVAAVLLGGWGIAFLLTLVRNLGFKAERQGSAIYIEAGIFTRRRYFLSKERVNFLTLRQSLATKLCGFYSAFINCTGYGKEKNELSVLLPAADSAGISRTGKIILPELKLSENTYRPSSRAFGRFVFPPLVTIAGITVGLYLMSRFFPAVRSLLLFFMLMADLPAVWWLLVRITSFFHTGIGGEGEMYTFRSTYGYAIYTTVLNRDKIARVTLQQSFFQRFTGVADLKIRTYTEKSHTIRVSNLSLDRAKAFLDEFSR